MKERLVIKNFGPIKSADLTLSRFNVLIGEQATGKSTVAKLLAVCRYFSYIVDVDNFNINSFEEGLNAWGLRESLQDGSNIYYDCVQYSFTFQLEIVEGQGYDQENGEVYEYKHPEFTFRLKPKSKEFKHLIAELDKIKPEPNSGFYDFGWNIPVNFFQNYVSKVMDNPFYFPTERGLQSIFSLGRSSIQNISDSLFNQFAKLDQISRFFKTEVSIEPLNIIYKNDNGKGFVRKHNEEHFYSLFYAASGYQSTIPIVLTLEYYRTRNKSKTFIIEEPELNLFPSAQQRLMNYLVNRINSSNGSLLVTTHSPYILTSLNNLMYAYKAGQVSMEETSKIIGEEYWLNPNDVSAYMLLPNGEYENIIDTEEKLIKADRIDEISNEINLKFNDLLNIELGSNNDVADNE